MFEARNKFFRAISGQHDDADLGVLRFDDGNDTHDLHWLQTGIRENYKINFGAQCVPAFTREFAIGLLESYPVALGSQHSRKTSPKR